MSKQPKKQDIEERPEGDTGTRAEPAAADAAGQKAASGGGSTADGSAGPAVEALQKELAAVSKALTERDAKVKALEEEVSGLKDQYLRKLADYENFRKRMFREKDDAILYANSQLLNDLVGVLDNFDRAVQSSEASKDWKSLHDGVQMIWRSLLGLLESKYSLARYESLGLPFDPNLHEAVMSEQGDCPEPTIVEEFVKGYKLRDRILRSAKVKVRMPLEAAANDSEVKREANA